MSMNIVNIEGPALDRFRDAVTYLANQFESDRVFRVAVAVDDLDGSFKVKVNEGIWSPPMGTPRAQPDDGGRAAYERELNRLRGGGEQS